jgi:hypothetical protein
MLRLHPAWRPDLVGHPLLYSWSPEGQKLYAWLRYRVETCRDATPLRPPAHAPDAPAHDADLASHAALQAWRKRGYLATYATTTQILEEVLPRSRNTITKLLSEFRALRVCLPRRVSRGGHVFLLGEWEVRHSPSTKSDLYWECYYLDATVELDAKGRVEVGQA